MAPTCAWCSRASDLEVDRAGHGDTDARGIRREVQVGHRGRDSGRGSAQNMPSVSLAVSDIMSFVQGGSHTTSTVQSLTPSTALTL